MKYKENEAALTDLSTKKMLSLPLNSSKVCSPSTGVGKLFTIFGASTEKALTPLVMCLDPGTTRSIRSVNLSALARPWG